MAPRAEGARRAGGRHRRRAASATVAVVAAAACCAGAVGFVAGAGAPAAAGGRAGATALRAVANGWQKRLDRALLEVDVTPRARARNLERVLRDPGTVISDLGRAVSAVRERGMKEGHGEAIDILWPRGTVARSDLEGLFALRNQIPEIAEGLRSLDPAGSPAAGGPSAARPGLADLASGLLDLAADSGKREKAAEEVRNAFRRVPGGLETPKYKVVDKLTSETSSAVDPRVVEIRRYEPFTVARRPMSSGKGANFASGEGFTKLAGYLFGDNSQNVAMEMTAPVEISYNGSDEAAMAFVLPAAFADAPPAGGDDIEVVRVPERLVAVKAFPGVATEGEVARQRATLAEVLQEAGAFRQVNESEYSVLQYNPPYTVPWRRLNELAVVVEPAEAVVVEPAEAASSRSDDAPAPAEPSAPTPGGRVLTKDGRGRLRFKGL